jgi:hypothetical protein
MQRQEMEVVACQARAASSTARPPGILPGVASSSPSPGLSGRNGDRHGEDVGEVHLRRCAVEDHALQLPGTGGGVAGDLQGRVREELRVVGEGGGQRVGDRVAALRGQQVSAYRVEAPRPRAGELQRQAQRRRLGPRRDAHAEVDIDDLCALVEAPAVDGRATGVEVDGAADELVLRLREGVADLVGALRVGEPSTVERVLVVDPVGRGGVLGVGDQVGEAGVAVPRDPDPARVAVVAALDVDTDPVRGLVSATVQGELGADRGTVVVAGDAAGVPILSRDLRLPRPEAIPHGGTGSQTGCSVLRWSLGVDERRRGFCSARDAATKGITTAATPKCAIARTPPTPNSSTSMTVGTRDSSSPANANTSQARPSGRRGRIQDSPRGRLRGDPHIPLRS